ncbi:serine hydrolase [Sinorhizobium medicae]
MDTTALNAQQLAEITAAAANLKRRFGRLQKVTDHFSDVYALHFDEVLVPTQITIGNSGNISGILFWLPQYKRVDMREIFERIETIGLGSGAIISINDKAIRQVNADTPLSVGSAFKLEILAVYLRQISDGSIKPAEIHRLRADERRPPSGLLQDWPAGTPLTLDTLVNLMMSLSDNTATDIVIERLGLANLPSTKDILEGARETSQRLRWRRTARNLLQTIEALAFSPYLESPGGPLAGLDSPRKNFKGGLIGDDVCFVGAAETPQGQKVCAVLIVNDRPRAQLDDFAELFLNMFVAAFRAEPPPA